MNAALKIAKYRNKKGEMIEAPLDSGSSFTDQEARKRLNYTKEMLKTILQNNNPDALPSYDSNKEKSFAKGKPINQPIGLNIQ